MVIFLPLLVCLVGAVLVFVNYPNPPKPENQKWAEIGRAMLWMGLVSFLLTYHGQPFGIKP